MASLDHLLCSHQCYEQGNSTFPELARLEELVLDRCNIRSVHLDTFANLPRLRRLSLQDNPLAVFPAAALLPSLSLLSIGIQEDVEMEVGSEYFSFPADTFNKAHMGNLLGLEIHNANFGNLSDYHFSGLDNLQKLSLERSKFEHVSDMLFGNLTNLRNLSLAYITSKEPIELKHIEGPSNLINLDLTYSTLNLSSTPRSLMFTKHLLNGDTELLVNPVFLVFKSLEVLNMTGTLLELDNPLESLFLEYIENLTVLEVGENKIHSWNRTFLDKNLNLRRLNMAKNGLDVILTEEMIRDLFDNTRLETLDMSGNTFICNELVSTFFKLALNHSELFIVGYNNGTGYTCLDTRGNGTEVTFLDYVSTATNIDEGINIRNNNRRNFIIGLAIGGIVICILCGVVYNKRWYIRYHYYWLIKKPVKREEPFAFDVFISYSQANEDWVKKKLIPTLEESEPKLSVCYHERDFAAGKSIVENIVDSLDTSRKCLLVLSEEYSSSSWCMFEAHLASSRLIQVVKTKQ